MSKSIQTFSASPLGLRSVVTPAGGGPVYVHHADEAAFREVLAFVERHLSTAARSTGFRAQDVVAARGLPHTRVAVALSFLRERGMLGQSMKRWTVEPGYAEEFTEHALCEWFALAGMVGGGA